MRMHTEEKYTCPHLSSRANCEEGTYALSVKSHSGVGGAASPTGLSHTHTARATATLRRAARCVLIVHCDVT
jgi:hypothetical protein